MVETQVKFVVVGHHSRHKQALRLAESLGAFLLIDNSDRGANWNHHRALQWAADDRRAGGQLGAQSLGDRQRIFAIDVEATVTDTLGDQRARMADQENLHSVPQ